MNAPQLVRAKHLAREANVSLSLLYEWLTRHPIPHYRIGRVVVIDRIGFLEWLQKQRVPAPPSRGA